MISNPTPKFTSQIRSIRSVFGRNRTGTGSEKIDRIDRNRISGRTLPKVLCKLSEQNSLYSPFAKQSVYQIFGSCIVEAINVVPNNKVSEFWH